MTLPEDVLTPNIVLQCAMTPMSLPIQNITTRWTTPPPNSTVILSTDSTFTRYIVSIGNFGIMNGTKFPGTILAIPSLSYRDAGQYKCEGQVNGMTEWVSATVNLALNSKLMLINSI